MEIRCPMRQAKRKSRSLMTCRGLKVGKDIAARLGSIPLASASAHSPLGPNGLTVGNHPEWMERVRDAEGLLPPISVAVPAAHDRPSTSVASSPMPAASWRRLEISSLDLATAKSPERFRLADFVGGRPSRGASCSDRSHYEFFARLAKDDEGQCNRIAKQKRVESDRWFADELAHKSSTWSCGIPIVSSRSSSKSREGQLEQTRSPSSEPCERHGPDEFKGVADEAEASPLQSLKVRSPALPAPQRRRPVNRRCLEPPEGRTLHAPPPKLGGVSAEDVRDSQHALSDELLEVPVRSSRRGRFDKRSFHSAPSDLAL